MNRTQAQFILGACPPGPLPTDDPQVAEALTLAETDGGLATWLVETRSFDAVVAAKLRSIEPPADLKDAILAGRRRLAPAHMTVGSPRRKWARPVLWALAAMGVGMLGVAVFRETDDGGSDGQVAEASTAQDVPGDLRKAAAKFLSEQWKHDFDYPESSFPKIQQWAAEQPDQARIEVPADLAASQTYGCKVFEWQGHRAMLVCFIAKDDGQVIHIVSVDRSALPDAERIAPEQPPIFAQIGRWNTAVWSHGPRRYVALSTTASETLARYLLPQRL